MCISKSDRSKPDVMKDSIDFITRSHAYSSDKAIDLLGYQPKIALAEGMKRTQRWWKEKDRL
jgi:nucleoside-diphosphate-sugar epimerase